MHNEIEIELNDMHFWRLWPATQSRRLTKARYRFPQRGLTMKTSAENDSRPAAASEDRQCT